MIEMNMPASFQCHTAQNTRGTLASSITQAIMNVSSAGHTGMQSIFYYDNPDFYDNGLGE